MPLSLRSPRLLELFKHGRQLSFDKDEIVSSTDEHQNIAYIRKGFVKRYSITNAGAYGIQIIYGPTDVFALNRIYMLLLEQSLYSGPEVYHYRAICATELQVIEEASLVQAVQANPLIYRDLFAEAGRHLESTIQRLENQSLATAYYRVAHILLFYGKRFGERTAQGIKIPLPLTHETIAGVLSLSRETVTQAIIQLRNESLIKTGRNITIPSLEKLQEVAYS